MEKATFGAGCFWGVEEAFRKLKGVISVTSGYSGGSVSNPTYQEVCSKRTGHAEVVEVEFDPYEVSYDQLLELFWNIHDPTTLNRQGPDVGSQYRSVIFYHSPIQETKARQSKEQMQLSGRFKKGIVTAIEPARAFYRAEEYHQRYLQKHGRDSCSI